MLTERKVIRLGFAPTRRVLHTQYVFNKEVAGQFKDEIEQEVKKYPDLELINLDFLNEEGLLYDGNDAQRAADYFLEKKVDAVFIPHCNFGSEEAVVKMAKAVAKPVLLWGPRDDSPDEEGNRYRDSQCGLFATSKVLQQFHVPFTYITNCQVTDATFKKCFSNFLGSVSVVKAMTHLRIGQIGTRPSIFWSVKANELELLEKFGIEVVPITMTDLQRMLKENLENNLKEVSEEADLLASRFGGPGFTAEDWEKLANLKLTLRNWMLSENLTAAASQCWKPMDIVAGVAPCFVFSELTGEGYPVICESDIHGAVSSVIALAASRYQSPTFLADLTIRHPFNDNAELLWHCGVFPAALSEQGDSVARHFNRRNAAVGNWELRHGDITVVRFDTVNGEYSCLFGHGRGVDGPKTFGTYLWVEFNDWVEWEHKFIYGPYIHHCVGIYGKYAPVILEACKYLPGLKPDPVDPDKKAIEKYLK